MMIGRRIRALRTAAGITQAELARKIGIDQSKLSRIEDDEREAKLTEIFTILDILKIDGDSLRKKDVFNSAIEELQRRQKAELIASFDYAMIGTAAIAS